MAKSCVCECLLLLAFFLVTPETQAQIQLKSGDIIVANQDAFGGGGGVIRVDPVAGEQTVISAGGSFHDPEGNGIDITVKGFMPGD